MSYYKLNENGEPIRSDVFAAGPETRIGDDTIGDSRISTVFLCIDHGWGDSSPVLWETMVFGGPLDGEQERYMSRPAAIAGHAAMIERVKRAAIHEGGDDE